jgi:hypothetical protein
LFASGLTIESGSTGTETFCVPGTVAPAGLMVTLAGGTWPGECSWILKDEDGATIGSDQGGGDTMAGTCPACSDHACADTAQVTDVSKAGDLQAGAASDSDLDTFCGCANPPATCADFTCTQAVYIVDPSKVDLIDPSDEQCCILSCAAGEAVLSVVLMDSWGDSWNGNTWEMNDCSGASISGPHECPGCDEPGKAVLADTFCLDLSTAAYAITSAHSGSYSHETSWELINVETDVVVASGSGTSDVVGAGCPTCADTYSAGAPQSCAAGLAYQPTEGDSADLTTCCGAPTCGTSVVGGDFSCSAEAHQHQRPIFVKNQGDEVCGTADTEACATVCCITDPCHGVAGGMVLHMHDSWGNGWGPNNNIELRDCAGAVLMDPVTLPGGAYAIHDVCVVPPADGMYEIVASRGTEGVSNHHDQNSWFLYQLPQGGGGPQLVHSGGQGTGYPLSLDACGSTCGDTDGGGPDGHFICPANTFYRTERHSETQVDADTCCQSECPSGYWAIHIASAGMPAGGDVTNWVGHEVHMRDCSSGDPLHTNPGGRVGSIPFVAGSTGAPGETNVCIQAPITMGFLFEIAESGIALTLRDGHGGLVGWAGDSALLGDPDLAAEAELVTVQGKDVYSTCPIATCADTDYVGTPFACDGDLPHYNPATGPSPDPDASKCCVATCVAMGATEYTLKLVDDWGDGWGAAPNQNTWQMSDCTGAPTTAAFTMEDTAGDLGALKESAVCLVDGGDFDSMTYLVSVGGGSWTSEISWELITSSGEIVATGADAQEINNACPTCGGAENDPATPYECLGIAFSDESAASETDLSAATCCMSCDGTVLKIELQDTYGDGWSGNTFQMSTCDGSVLLAPLTVSADDGDAMVPTIVCLDDSDAASNVIEVGGGTWGSEVRWNVTDITDPAAPVAVASGEGSGGYTVPPSTVVAKNCPTCGDTDINAAGEQAFFCGGDRPRFLSGSAAATGPNTGKCCGPACPHANDWDLQFYDGTVRKSFDVSITLTDCGGASMLGEASQHMFAEDTTVYHDLCIPAQFRLTVAEVTLGAQNANWKMFDPAGAAMLAGSEGSYSTCGTCTDVDGGDIVNLAIVPGAGATAYACSSADRPLVNPNANAAAVPSDLACCSGALCLDTDGAGTPFTCSSGTELKVSSGVACGGSLDVVINSKNWGHEITWSVNTGPTVAGVSDDSQTHAGNDNDHDVDMTMATSSTHTFTFGDDYGDGWHDGFWTLKDGCGNVLGGGPEAGMVGDDDCDDDTGECGTFSFELPLYSTTATNDVCCGSATCADTPFDTGTPFACGTGTVSSGNDGLAPSDAACCLPETICEMDADDSGKIGVNDLLALLDVWSVDVPAACAV